MHVGKLGAISMATKRAGKASRTEQLLASLGPLRIPFPGHESICHPASFSHAAPAAVCAAFLAQHPSNAGIIDSIGSVLHAAVASVAPAAPFGPAEALGLQASQQAVCMASSAAVQVRRLVAGRLGYALGDSCSAVLHLP